MFGLAFLATFACTGAATPQEPPALQSILHELTSDQPGPIHYFAARVDLNDDGSPEWIAHVVGPSVCGTGGCDTMVFGEGGHGLELVARISATRPPIAIADTTTMGWRDLVVHVAGGGILPGYDAKLRFDGSSYPSNATVDPAEPLKGTTTGRAIIRPFQSSTEGEKLR